MSNFKYEFDPFYKEYDNLIYLQLQILRYQQVAPSRINLWKYDPMQKIDKYHHDLDHHKGIGNLS